MGRTNSLHPTTQIYTIQITLVINLESTDHQFGVLDFQKKLNGNSVVILYHPNK